MYCAIHYNSKEIMYMKTIGFLGCGNMATAIILGICSKMLDAKIIAYDINPSQVEKLACHGVEFVPLEQLVVSADYLVLAVKPQMLAEAVKDVTQKVSKDIVIISIVAGSTKQSIDNLFGFDTKVVMVMPNTPLMVGEGATAIAKNDKLDDEDFSFACDIFKASGKVCLIDEDKLKEIIPINGSSPAYIYHFAKQFIEYGEQVGLDEQTVKELFVQTLIGSAKMLLESDSSIDNLIDMVCSKGGTTIAGLDKMKEFGFDHAVQQGLKRCTERAYELA